MEFAEFENFMLTSGVLNKIPDEMDENLRDAFKILDKNNDGYIDKEELIFYMTKFGQQLVFFLFLYQTKSIFYHFFFLENLYM